MNEGEKIEVWPFLDWSLVQAGTVKFMDSIKKQRLAYPQSDSIPYGISINSQEAKKTSVWLKAEKPWEAMCLSSYLTVMYEDGIYRLWYESMGVDVYPDFESRLCYAESKDGCSWRKTS